MDRARSTGLVFLEDQAGEEEGLGHAGIETYKDTPYASVARECGQNSADAGTTKPVVVKFDLIEIARPDYPSLPEHYAAISACLEKSKRTTDEKEIDFFTRAKEILESDTLKILRIADFNTKGLIGPSQPGTPFHSLVKASGVSNKDSDTSGGSFGIGKNAAFAVSELQCVYYSTVYQIQGSGQVTFLAQGKTILISHTDSSGTNRRATGYWGLPDFQPITDPADAPSWLRRDDVGTSVFAVGFRECKRWQYRLAASLLGNFFCAIHRGDMEFVIDEGRLKIDRSTIKMLFQDPLVLQAADDSDQREDFDFSKHLFECLISHEAIGKELAIEGMGKVSVRIFVREGLPKRVCIVRNGMVITDNLAHFGDRFANFPMYKEFVALVEPVEHDGSALIKRLENPRHNGLSAERIPDAAKRAAATKTMKKLAREIRDAIKEQAMPKVGSEVTLDELSEFFDDTEPADRPQEPGYEDNPETFTYTPETVREERTATEAARGKGAAGGAGGAGGEGGGSSGGRGPGQGRGSGGSGPRGRVQALVLDSFRNVLAPKQSEWHRTLFFTPKETARAAVTILAAGLESTEALSVVRADHGQVGQGALEIDLRAGERTTLKVAFSEPYAGPVELVATKVAKKEGTGED